MLYSKVLRCISDLLGLVWRPGSNAEAALSIAPIATSERPEPVSMAALREMIADGRVSDILSWACDLKAAEPRRAGFADDVHAAARRLGFQALRELSEELGIMSE